MMVRAAGSRFGKDFFAVCKGFLPKSKLVRIGLGF